MQVNSESIKHRILGGAIATSLFKDGIKSDDAVNFIKKTYKPAEIEKAHDDYNLAQEMLKAFMKSKGLNLSEYGMKEGTKMTPYKSKFTEAGDIAEQTRQLVADIVNRGQATEKEMNLIKDRLNAKRITSEDYQPIWDAEIECDAPWANKGIIWLWNQYKSPTGKERSSNPFGGREEMVLEAAAKMEGNKPVGLNEGAQFIWKGFYDAGNSYNSFWIPLYELSAGEGSFEYYVSGGKISIVG